VGAAVAGAGSRQTASVGVGGHKHAVGGRAASDIDAIASAGSRPVACARARGHKALASGYGVDGTFASAGRRWLLLPGLVGKGLTLVTIVLVLVRIGLLLVVGGIAATPCTGWRPYVVVGGQMAVVADIGARAFAGVRHTLVIDAGAGGWQAA
jgi:hypothetical protein